MKKLKVGLIVTILVSAAAWAGLGIVYHVTLNFPLYKGEHYFQGTAQTEYLSFIAGGERVMKAQKLIAESADHKLRRVFHAKQHGCLTGRLVLLKDRPADTERATFQGMFDPSKTESYDVIMRFSNGVGVLQPDRKADVRGAAIKVLGVQNSQTGQKQSVDFLMTNSPTPFGRDFLEFAAFMDSVAKHGPVLGTSLFSATHPEAGLALAKAAGVLDYKVKSAVTLRYWGGHPYLLGANKAMKFNIIPSERPKYRWKTIKTWGDDYLRKDLSLRAKNGSIKYTFAIQLEKDEKHTPIERNLHEWKEKDTPSIPVAEIILDQQDFSKPEIDEACESLRFTPGHYIPEHRPLSNLGRGRLFAYEASQIGRGASPQEPDANAVAKWRELNRIK